VVRLRLDLRFWEAAGSKTPAMSRATNTAAMDAPRARTANGGDRWVFIMEFLAEVFSHLEDTVFRGQGFERCEKNL
jgi:hypothetical protein